MSHKAWSLTYYNDRSRFSQYNFIHSMTIPEKYPMTSAHAFIMVAKHCSDTSMGPDCKCPPLHTVFASALHISPGVDKKVPLQSCIFNCGCPPRRSICDQCQFVEYTTTKVFCNHAESIISVLQLVLEVVIQVLLLFLSPDHIEDLSVLWQAGGTVRVALRITLKAVLVERVATQEVYRRQLQSAATDAALSLLKDLRAVPQFMDLLSNASGVFPVLIDSPFIFL